MYTTCYVTHNTIFKNRKCPAYQDSRTLDLTGILKPPKSGKGRSYPVSHNKNVEWHFYCLLYLNNEGNDSLLDCLIKNHPPVINFLVQSQIKSFDYLSNFSIRLQIRLLYSTPIRAVKHFRSITFIHDIIFRVSALLSSGSLTTP